MCLNETWAKSEVEFDNAISGYKCFSSFNEKRSRFGRHSGGVSIFVVNHLAPYVKRVLRRSQNVVLITIDKTILRLNKDILLCAVYVPPERSPMYSRDSDGIENLEQIILDAYAQLNDFYLIIAGDFNARTGELPDYIVQDSDVFLQPGYESDNFELPRRSKDNV